LKKKSPSLIRQDGMRVQVVVEERDTCSKTRKESLILKRNGTYVMLPVTTKHRSHINKINNIGIRMFDKCKANSRVLD